MAGPGTCVATAYPAFCAYIQVKQGKHQARQKAAIGLPVSGGGNPHYRQRRRVCLNMRRNRENFTSLACKIQEKGEHESKNPVVSDVLNAIGFTAVGIKGGISGESVYRRMGGGVLADRKTLKPYIMELRRLNNNDRLSCEFERLADRRGNNPSKTGP
ncbi:DUF4760 domain-containing protein [Neisseria gonorrhoeae]|uniref:DUF4760 domain-containing protein n=1 Tax=Neisseria gonorrhoeae TaxID=485 RepID=UPI00178330FD|nr:DUF4760 domain-containing protein [Neisseria gonorrhoeae]QOG38785.1 DUF4760 domain-containing protein [Neisseria gonorrhoeae]